MTQNKYIAKRYLGNLAPLMLLTLFVMNNSSAADTHPIYVSFGAGRIISGHGSSITNNSNSILYAPTATAAPSLFGLQNVRWQNSYTNGFDANVAVGTALNSNIRVEGEFSYQNTNRHINGSYDWVELNTQGNDVFTNQYGNVIGEQAVTVNLYSLLANIYYDFKKSTTWIPYVGGGLGFAWIKSPNSNVTNVLSINDQTASTITATPTIATSPSLSGTAFAAQIKAGLAYALAPNFNIAVEYRLFCTTHFHSSSSTINTNPGVPGSAVFSIPGGNISGIINNTFNVVFRYTF